MDKFTLEIETANAAFEDESAELARILRNVADRIERGIPSGLIADSNGNTVGAFRLN